MVRTCPSCGSRNRIPTARLDAAAHCGRCKTAMSPVREPIEVTDVAVFDDLARNAPMPVLVDFWATWCGPCRAVAPEVARAARDLAGRALVLKVDIDRVPALADRYSVTSIPSFAVIRGGTVVVQRTGAMRSADLVRLAA